MSLKKLIIVLLLVSVFCKKKKLSFLKYIFQSLHAVSAGVATLTR